MKILEKHSWKVFVLILGIIPFLCPIKHFELQAKADLFKLMVVFPVSLLVASIWLAYLAKINRKINFSITDFILISFILWSFVTLLWAQTPLEGLKSISPWIAAFLLSIVAGNILNSPDRIKFLTRTFMISVSVVALLGIVQHLFGNQFFMVAVSPAATFGNRNMAGQFVLICLPFLILGLIDKDKKWRILSYLGIWISVTFQILIRSRAVFLGLSLQTIVFVVLGLLYMKRNNIKIQFKWKSLVIVFCMVLGSVLIFNTEGSKEKAGPSSFSQRLGTTIQSFQGQSKHGVNERVPTWLNTFEMVKDHFFFGVGSGQWKIDFPLYNNLVQEDVVYNGKVVLNKLHNDYLEYFATLGIIGLLLLIAPVLVTFKNMSELWRTKKQDLVVICVIMSFVGIAVPAFTSFPLHHITPLLFIMLVLKFASFHYSREVKREEFVLKIRRLGAGLSALVLFVAIFPVSDYHFRMVNAMAIYLKGDAYKTLHPQKDKLEVKKQVFQMYKDAYKIDPTNNIIIMRNISYGNGLGFRDYATGIGEAAQKYYPYDKMIQRMTFETYLKKKDKKGMKRMADRLMKYSPRCHFSYVAMGNSYWLLRKRREALYFYEKAIEFKKPVAIPTKAITIINQRREKNRKTPLGSRVMN